MTSSDPPREAEDDSVKTQPTPIPSRWKWRGPQILALLVLVTFVIVGGLDKRRLRRWGLPDDITTFSRRLNELSVTGTISDLGWLPRTHGPRSLDISNSNIVELDVPAYVESLVAIGVSVDTLEGLPAGLRSLEISGPGLAHVDRLPPRIEELSITTRELRRRMTLPSTLRRLEIRLSESDLPPLILPSGLQHFSLEGITNPTPPELPQGLRVLELRDTKLATLERPRPLGVDPSTQLRGLRHLHLRGNPDLEIDVPTPMLVGLSVDGHQAELICEDLPAHLQSLTLGPEPTRMCRPGAATFTGLRKLTLLEGAVRSGTVAATPAVQKVVVRVVSDAQREALATLGIRRFDSLELGGLQADDLSALDVAVRSLTLSDCHLDRLDGIPTSVQRLSILNCSIDDPTPPSAPDLAELVYPWSPWKDIPSGLPHLRTLDLEASSLETMTHVPPRLRELRIPGTGVSELPVEKLGKLEVLDIANTPITDPSQVPERVRELTLHLGQFRTLRTLPASVRVLRLVPAENSDSTP